MTGTNQDEGRGKPVSEGTPPNYFRPLGFLASLTWFVLATLVCFLAVGLLLVLTSLVTDVDVIDSHVASRGCHAIISPPYRLHAGI